MHSHTYTGRETKKTHCTQSRTINLISCSSQFNFCAICLAKNLELWLPLRQIKRVGYSYVWLWFPNLSNFLQIWLALYNNKRLGTYDKEGERPSERERERKRAREMERRWMLLTEQLSIFSRIAICISHSSLLNFELLQITWVLPQDAVILFTRHWCRFRCCCCCCFCWMYSYIS